MTAFTTAYPGTVKSIQHGSISITTRDNSTNTATITSVSTAKTVLYYLGSTQSNVAESFPDNTVGVGLYFGRLTLTNATTITLTRTGSGGGGNNNITVGFIALEYN